MGRMGKLQQRLRENAAARKMLAVLRQVPELQGDEEYLPFGEDPGQLEDLLTVSRMAALHPEDPFLEELTPRQHEALDNLTWEMEYETLFEAYQQGRSHQAAPAGRQRRKRTRSVQAPGAKENPSVVTEERKTWKEHAPEWARDARSFRRHRNEAWETHLEEEYWLPKLTDEQIASGDYNRRFIVASNKQKRQAKREIRETFEAREKNYAAMKRRRGSDIAEWMGDVERRTRRRLTPEERAAQAELKEKEQGIQAARKEHRLEKICRYAGIPSYATGLLVRDLKVFPSDYAAVNQLIFTLNLGGEVSRRELQLLLNIHRDEYHIGLARKGFKGENPSLDAIVDRCHEHSSFHDPFLNPEEFRPVPAGFDALAVIETHERLREGRRSLYEILKRFSEMEPEAFAQANAVVMAAKPRDTVTVDALDLTFRILGKGGDLERVEASYHQQNEHVAKMLHQLRDHTAEDGITVTVNNLLLAAAGKKESQWKLYHYLETQSSEAIREREERHFTQYRAEVLAAHEEHPATPVLKYLQSSNATPQGAFRKMEEHPELYQAVLGLIIATRRLEGLDYKSVRTLVTIARENGEFSRLEALPYRTSDLKECMAFLEKTKVYNQRERRIELESLPLPAPSFEGLMELYEKVQEGREERQCEKEEERKQSPRGTISGEEYARLGSLPFKEFCREVASGEYEGVGQIFTDFFPSQARRFRRALGTRFSRDNGSDDLLREAFACYLETGRPVPGESYDPKQNIIRGAELNGDWQPPQARFPPGALSPPVPKRAEEALVERDIYALPPEELTNEELRLVLYEHDQEMLQPKAKRRRKAHPLNEWVELAEQPHQSLGPLLDRLEKENPDLFMVADRASAAIGLHEPYPFHLGFLFRLMRNRFRLEETMGEYSDPGRQEVIDALERGVRLSPAYDLLHDKVELHGQWRHGPLNELLLAYREAPS